MDISSYISELLFDYDCVIVPGFGGFICNYKPAEIHPVLNTIAPPSKAVSFNRNLQSNDGLLVNHISSAQSVSYETAYELVHTWASSANYLLKKNEELHLKRMGRFENNWEGNVQFTPTEEVNYLKTSFGLRTITAEPVLRNKQIEFTEKFAQEIKHPISSKRVWNMAASVLLIVSLVVFAELMWMGLNIKPAEEAGMLHCITNIFKSPEAAIKPAPVETKTEETKKPEIESVKTEQVVEEAKTGIIAPPVATGPTYYIVVGAFAEEKNIEVARQKLLEKFDSSQILIEQNGRLTKLGYSVGTNFNRAKEELITARAENSAYWLLKK